MAHLSLFPGAREIVEIGEEEEEIKPAEHYRNPNYKPDLKWEEKDRRSLASNAGRISSLEEDLNQLFEIFNRRASSHGLAHTNQAGPSRKNSSKKPIKAGGSHSPGHGISEKVNLKQALRGLCLSQASEMAAMKRSAKASGSSEAGRIMTMYRNVVVEDNISELSQDDGRGGLLEISLVPEEPNFGSFRNVPEDLPGTTSLRNKRAPESKDCGDQILKPEKHTSVTSSSLPEPTSLWNKRASESKDCGGQILKPEKPSTITPSSFSHDNNVLDLGHVTSNQIGMVTTSNEVRKQMIPSSSTTSTITTTPRGIAPQTGFPSSSTTATITTASRGIAPQTGSPSSSISTAKNSVQEVAKSTMTEIEEFSFSAEFGSQTSLSESLQKEKRGSPCPSPSSYGNNSLELPRKTQARKEMTPVSVGSGNQMSNVEHKSSMAKNGKFSPSADFACSTPLLEPLQKEKHAFLPDSSSPSDGKNSLELARKIPEYKEMVSEEHAPKSAKVEIKEPGLKAVQKDGSKAAPSSGSPKGKKASKSTRNAHHFVKPLIKTRNFVKRKSKKKTAQDSSKSTHSEFTNDLYSSPNPIVCPRCQCVVSDAWKEASQESQESLQESPVSHQESPVSHQESPVSQQESPLSYQDSPMSDIISDVSTPGPSSDSINKPKTVVTETKGNNSHPRYKGEFTQSSKDSPGESSSSTSVSEESNLSRPSFCDRPHMSKDVRWQAIRRVRFENGSIGLRHFNLLKKLGCGDIGTVYLAELIGTNCLFAIKVMDNEFLVRRKKISRAQTEREILRKLDHPFLPTLYCQFTSDNLSCLVMEYCPGGDLHVLRQRQPGRCFTEQAARFYVAEVLLALEYLHMLGVIYRDLKPENILVREDGHIMLSDFDLSLRCAVSPTLLSVSSSISSTTSKKTANDPCGDSRCVQPLCIEPSCQVSCFTPRLLASSKSKLKKDKNALAAEMRPLLQLVAEPTTARSNSFVGTHEYLAPEIIKGEGHGSAVDWWTFGIFLYELLYGRTPFKGAGNEETLANVVLQTLKFPDCPLVSLQARDLIAVLLVKEPENRLGTERGAAEIKQHPFFDGLNWALIRCALPPELPEQRAYGVPRAVPNGSSSGEHLEFEVF